MPSMMEHTRRLAPRAASNSSTTNPLVTNLMLALLVLFSVASLLAGALLLLRYRRRRARSARNIPLLTSEKRLSSSSTAPHHRRTRARPSTSIHIHTTSTPHTTAIPPSAYSPVPEIRVTLPEEIDSNGKRQSGRVVVVRVGDHGLGLEPMDENLPVYQRSGDEPMHSIDLHAIGGLAEKKHSSTGWD